MALAAGPAFADIHVDASCEIDSAFDLTLNPRSLILTREDAETGLTIMRDTLRDLKKQRPDAELYFITGADSLASIMSWHNWEEMLEMAHFVGVTRPGYELSADMLPADAQEAIDLIDIPAMAISSTACRERAGQGQPVWYLVPDGVVQYITKNNLYGPNPDKPL